MAGIESTHRAHINVAAIRGTAVGRMVRTCMESEVGAMREMGEFRERTGFDVMNSLESFTFSDDLVALTGDFSDTRLEQFHDVGKSTVTPYGIDSRIVTQQDTAFSISVGVWQNKVMLISPKHEMLVAALDRLEGRVQASPERISNAAISGRAPVEELVEMSSLHGQLAVSLRSALQDSGLDFEYEVRLSDGIEGFARVDTTDEFDLDGVGGALSGALFASRALDLPDGMAEVMNGIDISQDRAGITIEGDVGVETVRVLLGECANDVM